MRLDCLAIIAELWDAAGWMQTFFRTFSVFLEDVPDQKAFIGIQVSS